MKLEVRSHEVRSKNHEVRSSNELPGLPYKIDPPLLRSFGGDVKPRSRLRITSLLVLRRT